MAKELLVLFDGNSLVHRAFHAFQRNREPLTVHKTGEIVSAVYGFASMLLKVINDRKPDYCAVAFDMAAPTFRHAMFVHYKENRPETPDELVHQLKRAREVVQAFGIPIYEKAGFEADDLLGTLAYEAQEKGFEVIVVTGDADAMQLVSDGVSVLYPKPGQAFSETQLFDASLVKEKYGVTPLQFADFKGLKGDASDNIPGVPGIGDKTAVKLLSEFGSIDGVYEHLSEVNPPRIRESLAQNKAGAYESRELATIKRDTAVELKTARCALTSENQARVIELFRELEFVSLIDRLPEAKETGHEAASAEAGPKERVCHLVNAKESLSQLTSLLQSTGEFAFDTETATLDAMKGELVGISFAMDEGEAFYIPVGHTGLIETTQLSLDTVTESIKPLMEDAKVAKRAHNGKYDMIVLAQNGIRVHNLVFDSMIAGYLLGEKALNLKDLAFNRLGVLMTPISELIGTGKKAISMSQVSIEQVKEYCGEDAGATWELSELLKPELEKQGLWSLFADIEMPLVPVLINMEMNGILVDKEKLAELSKRLEREINAIQDELYKIIGHSFNINSTHQLGLVLFDEMGLTAGRKTKTGYSTEAAVLEDLRRSQVESEKPEDRDRLKILNMILEYRTLTKLKSTYIDALPELINPKTGRIHTSFNQTVATTGRLSSSDPNLQNIPVRGELGKEIRGAFIAPPGKLLIAGDYSQIDLRVLAHLSQDPALLATFRAGKDVHSTTASQLFGVPQDKVTPDMRRLAKTVNFGVIYGMSDYGLEQATELSRAQAHQFIAEYFARFPGVKQYLEETKQMVRTKGYVQTLLGRRRYLPEINSPNRQVREAAERMAINMPVQGTSADIIKIAMVRLCREMDKKQIKSMMLLQVHDELIFEVPEDELEMMLHMVPEIMSTAIILSIPIKVDMKKGRNWGEME